MQYAAAVEMEPQLCRLPDPGSSPGMTGVGSGRCQESPLALRERGWGARSVGHSVAPAVFANAAPPLIRPFAFAKAHLLPPGEKGRRGTHRFRVCENTQTPPPEPPSPLVGEGTGMRGRSHRLHPASAGILSRIEPKSTQASKPLVNLFKQARINQVLTVSPR